mgnify:CR=1 FL=1
MSHYAARPKGPAPLAEVITVRKPVKYLGTLLSMETEEVFNADGTNKRVLRVGDKPLSPGDDPNWDHNP